MGIVGQHLDGMKSLLVVLLHLSLTLAAAPDLLVYGLGDRVKLNPATTASPSSAGRPPSSSAGRLSEDSSNDLRWWINDGWKPATQRPLSESLLNLPMQKRSAEPRESFGDGYFNFN